MRKLLILAGLCLGVSGPLLAADLPASLEDLGLRENAVASRDLPGWEKPKKVVVWNIFGQDFSSTLAPVAPGVEIAGVSSVAEAKQAAAGAQAIIGFCNQEVFDASSSLHWVQVFFAGVENCVSQPALQKGDIILTNGQRLSSPAIADYTIGVMMNLMRTLDVYQRSQVAGKWQPQRWDPSRAVGEVQGRTLLVVGLGGIGTQVAKRAHALGMKVLATRGSRREGPDYIEYVGLSHEAVELAARADVVVNSAPLTKQTRGMFDRAFFKAMKPSAYFISVGRGASTVTDDLVAALQNGEIAGAGLDVTDPEPLPEGHVLWSMDRVIITPHISAQSPESFQRIGALVAENLRRYVAGEPLLSVVNVKRGY